MRFWLQHPKLIALLLGTAVSLPLFVIGAYVILHRPKQPVTYSGTIRRIGDTTATPFAVQEDEVSSVEQVPPSPSLPANNEDSTPHAYQFPSVPTSALTKTPYTRFFIPDPILGQRLAPDAEVMVNKMQGERLIYSATYRTDSHGRRITPLPEVTEGDTREPVALLFFGGSYAFGEGVEDTETLPAQTAFRLPGVHVYNYGIPGAGPQQMLEQLMSERIAIEVPERRAIAVYVFLHVHINRAIGTDRLVRSYASGFPWYELDVSDRLVRRGVFRDRKGMVRRRTSKMLEGIEDYYGERLTEEDARLTARILEESKRLFETRFESLGFCLLHFPFRDGAWTDTVSNHMSAGGAEILDYRSALGLEIDHDEYFIPLDGHPRPKTHSLLAQRLAKDIEILLNNNAGR